MRCLLCNVATNSRLAVNDQVRLQRRSEERTTLNVADTVTQERTSALNVERSGLICGLEGIKTGMTTGMTTGVKTGTKTDTKMGGDHVGRALAPQRQSETHERTSASRYDLRPRGQEDGHEDVHEDGRQRR